MNKSIELKAKAFELVVLLENTQKELREVQVEIAQALQEEAKPTE